MWDWLLGWWPMAIAGGLYLLQAAGYTARGEHGMALAFLAYAVANAGFVWQWWSSS